MYRGYNLTISEQALEGYAEDGAPSEVTQKLRVKEVLNSFTDAAGNLIASKLTAEWFPNIKADVFISHSHKDSTIATKVAGFLQYEFGLTSFIDSSVWGYSDELLKIIDDAYCYQSKWATYNYTKRNRSTSHVHMMLSTAITKMIDSCECLMFLNTPLSISSKDYINGTTTDSPWIYSEIAMTRLIQKKTPGQHRFLSKADSIALDEALKVSYEIDLSHLASLNEKDLLNWRTNCTSKGTAALDLLYGLT